MRRKAVPTEKQAGWKPHMHHMQGKENLSALLGIR
jgi:hypothetical protein